MPRAADCWKSEKPNSLHSWISSLNNSKNSAAVISVIIVSSAALKTTLSLCFKEERSSLSEKLCLPCQWCQDESQAHEWERRLDTSAWLNLIPEFKSCRRSLSEARYGVYHQVAHNSAVTLTFLLLPFFEPAENVLRSEVDFGVLVSKAPWSCGISPLGRLSIWDSQWLLNKHTKSLRV